MEKITVLLADDHKMVVNALAHLVNSSDSFIVAGEAYTREMVIDLVISKRPQIVVMEINLASAQDYSLTKYVRKYLPAAKIVWLSAYPIVAYIKGMVGQGCTGLITKNSTREEFMKTLAEVLAGKKYICEEIKNLLADEMVDSPETLNIKGLTRKELAVISYLKEGFSSKEIALQQGVSLKTVEVHRYNILRKLKMKNVAALINYINLKGL